jgi:Putative peptidoglycan binding domain/L,D-transpeptidase catalytic domain
MNILKLKNIGFYLVLLLGSTFVLGFSATDAHAAGGGGLGKQAVLAAEQKLSELGYLITKVDGVADESTYHAVAAFQKVQGLKITGRLSKTEIATLRTAEKPEPKYKGFAHVELDLGRQVLLLVNEEDVVTLILPISSGSEKRYFSEGKWQTAHTPRGFFKIERKIDGTRHAPLGDIFYPNYFHGGVAIHGLGSVPFTAASHGCARIPKFAAADFSSRTWVGMDVIVYD